MNEPTENHLIPIQQKNIQFQGDTLPAAKAENDTIYVPIRPLCDFLGLNFASQSKRIQRDEILSEVRGVVMMTTPSGDQPMVCLPIEYLNGWLFGIQSSRVKPELREKIREYKYSCYHVLAAAFSPKSLGPYDGPSIGLNLVLRLTDDFNNLRKEQEFLHMEYETIRMMLGHIRTEIKQIKNDDKDQ